MAKIADQMITLVARLTVSNELSGHSEVNARQELEDNYEYKFTDKQWDRLQNSLEDADGHWYVSDYGIKPLQNLAAKLYGAKTSEERLQIVDRMLNVVHQRGDLSSMFVEGGKATLNKIAGQGGYETKFDDFSDQVRQQHAY